MEGPNLVYEKKSMHCDVKQASLYQNCRFYNPQSCRLWILRLCQMGDFSEKKVFLTQLCIFSNSAMFLSCSREFKSECEFEIFRWWLWSRDRAPYCREGYICVDIVYTGALLIRTPLIRMLHPPNDCFRKHNIKINHIWFNYLNASFIRTILQGTKVSGLMRLHCIWKKSCIFFQCFSY
jgi:hypothetical protein